MIKEVNFKMNPEIKKEWIDALNSGEYKQGMVYLKRNNQFCCLGVLCDIYSKKTGKGNWEPAVTDYGVEKFTVGDKIDTSGLPVSVREWSGVSGALGELKQRSLAMLNDEGMTFKDLAKVIEEQL